MKMITNEKGMSLIEMMVVTAIIASFSVFIVGLMSVTRDAVAIQNIGTPVRTEAKQTMDNMAKEFREAVPDSAQTPIDISGSQITFYKPRQVNSTGIQSYRCVQFDMNGAQILKRESDDDCSDDPDPEIIGRNVDSIQFTYNGSDLITATVNVQEASLETAATMRSTLTSEFKLRNGS